MVLYTSFAIKGGTSRKPAVELATSGHLLNKPAIRFYSPTDFESVGEQNEAGNIEVVWAGDAKSKN